MKRILLAAFAAIVCFAAHAQTFDSVHVDTTVVPSPTYIRIKFPHSGFQLTDCFSYYPLSLPPSVEAKFIFKECKGVPIVTYFDTTLNLYVNSDGRVFLMLYLEANATDSNCVLRSSPFFASSVFIDYWSASQSVKRMESSTSTTYPNPITNHKFTVGTASGQLTKVSIYNMQGSLLASYPLNGTKAEVDLPSYISAGNYLLQIQMQNGNVDRRLLIVQ